MANLSFAVERVSPVVHAACPSLSFHIRIVNSGIERIHAIALEAIIYVEPQPQPPTSRDVDRLEELFGEPSHWAESRKPLAWVRASAIVPAFAGSTRIDLDVPCSFDFNIASTKFFYGLEAPSAPLRFDFTGTIFVDRQVSQIAPAKQARFDLPMAAWSDLMEAYYPHSMWLRLPRDVFQRMNQYKIENRIPTWEDVLERLLPVGQEAVQ